MFTGHIPPARFASPAHPASRAPDLPSGSTTRYPSGMDTLITVASFSTHIEADLARSALEAAGIEAMIAADDAGGQRPHMAFSQGVELMVRAEDEAAARQVLSGDMRE